jgi:ankyrin repeat protein
MSSLANLSYGSRAVDREQKAARIVQLVVDDDATALSQYLLSLVEENRQSIESKYYLGVTLNVPDCNGWRPLHHAFHHRRYDCAKFLIDAGERLLLRFYCSFQRVYRRGMVYALLS